MKVVHKKFQTVVVGAGLMSNEYHKKLEADGYELYRVEMGKDSKIETYTFKLKESENVNHGND